MQPELLQLGLIPMKVGRFYIHPMLQEKEKMVFQKWIKIIRFRMMIKNRTDGIPD
jgi:hypothetical protein